MADHLTVGVEPAPGTGPSTGSRSGPYHCVCSCSGAYTKRGPFCISCTGWTWPEKTERRNLEITSSVLDTLAQKQADYNIATSNVNGCDYRNTPGIRRWLIWLAAAFASGCDPYILW